MIFPIFVVVTLAEIYVLVSVGDGYWCMVNHTISYHYCLDRINPS